MFIAYKFDSKGGRLQMGGRFNNGNGNGLSTTPSESNMATRRSSQRYYLILPQLFPHITSALPLPAFSIQTMSLARPRRQDSIVLAQAGCQRRAAPGRAPDQTLKQIHTFSPAPQHCPASTTRGWTSSSAMAFTTRYIYC